MSGPKTTPGHKMLALIIATFALVIAFVVLRGHWN
jgi:hypothetical protein